MKTDAEIYASGSKFDVEILEEASYILWYIWRDNNPRFSTLRACIDALTESQDLYKKLKAAHARRKYNSIRSWVLPSSSLTPGRQVDVTISDFLDELRPGMKRLVNGEVALNVWAPTSESMDAVMAAHLTKLRIPFLNGRPNVLLHDLGCFKDDPILTARLNNIFMPNSHNFLVNTSGSGKTRLLLEGLCENWGFYFTSLVDSSLLGSSDVQNSIRAYIPNFPGFRQNLPPSTSTPAYLTALKTNREIAARVFSQIFLARLLIFDLFVDIMSQNPPVADQKPYRSRWLLLQLLPSLILPRVWDIFDELLGMLSQASDVWINEKTKATLVRVRSLCTSTSTPNTPQRLPHAGPSTPPAQIPLFCVLDEAQYAATEHASSFRSDQNGAHRPILREIVRAWEGQSFGHGVFMVVAGTGISKDVVDQAMASAIMKDSKYRWCSDTGAFDDVEVQKRYLLRYLPPSLAQSKSGERLLQRVWYWLHGRHRFTAGYVAELIVNGFRRPHNLLNAYIHHFTQFNPTDAETFVQEEGQETISISSRYKLDFFKLKKNSEMIATIHEITTHYLMRSVVPGTLGKDEATYVEYGFARFIDSETREVVVDEPLVILAATHWINHNYQTSYKHFAKHIHLHDPDSNGFENFTAYCLHMIFGQRRRVCDVFSFSGSTPKWAEQEAMIVAFHRPGQGTIELGSVSHASQSGPSVTLGTNAKTINETCAWLEHREHTPFCFPHIAMGPDVLFVLKLSDGSSIWVALQTKYSVGRNGSLSRPYLRRAMRSVTPLHYFIDKEGNQHSPATMPHLIEETSQRLLSLPNRRSDVGRYSLLRVVVSFPAQTNLKRCLEEDPDTDSHPIASLNMELVKSVTKGMSPINFLERMEPSVPVAMVSARSSKRKLVVDPSGPRKRTRKLKL